MTTQRKYYMLYIRRNGKWEPEFGAYTRSEVQDEYDTYIECEGRKVVTLPSDTQACIDNMTLILNGV